MNKTEAKDSRESVPFKKKESEILQLGYKTSTAKVDTIYGK